MIKRRGLNPKGKRALDLKGKVLAEKLSLRENSYAVCCDGVQCIPPGKGCHYDEGVFINSTPQLLDI